MAAKLDSKDAEVQRLRRCLRDIEKLLELQSARTESDTSTIARAVLDTLCGMLPLRLAYLWLEPPGASAPIELARETTRQRSVGRIGAELRQLFGEAVNRWPAAASGRLAGDEVSIATLPVGFATELGMLVVAADRPEFPTSEEALLLRISVNQLETLLERQLAASGKAEEAQRKRELDSGLGVDIPSVIDGIPGFVAILTPEGGVEVANRQILEYTGQGLEDLKQWGTNGTVHAEDIAHVAEIFMKSISSGVPYEIEQRLRRFDGAYLWFTNRGVPGRDASGNIVRWYVLLTDIDERKRAEEALSASERDLQVTIDTIPALAWSARIDGLAEFFNQHYLDYVGLSAEQAGNWGWTAAVHPDDLNQLASVWQTILKSNKAGETEARLRRFDGEYRWFLFRTNPLRDEQGNIVKWYGINTDIEDRKHAEAELKRAYDSFADAQRLSRTGSFITDYVGDKRSWSDEAYRIFEFEPGTKVTLQRIRDIVHPDDLQMFDSGMAGVSGGADAKFAYRIVTPAGVKHVRGLAHMVEQVAGRPMFVGAVQDVTESTVAEEALHRVRAELAYAARAMSLGVLTASIAHEVSQPLSGIITNTGTCLRMLAHEPPNVDGALETARRALRDGNRAAEVIGRLRALFGNKGFATEAVDLNEATLEVIALTRQELQKQRIVLLTELAEGMPGAMGDRVQLQQVILNLLLNAADAMKNIDGRPRQIVVQTAQDGPGALRLTVRDTGVGLAPDSLSKLFDAFYTTKPDGMGIGLSVSRSIIERHKGRLWVSPNQGPGTAFSFSIPCATAPGNLAHAQ